MKRRNGECGKLRRPIKRTKITDGIYGSTVLYLKFFVLWALVLLADFLLEFRFEFLWPFWLLLRSVYDSYKYQGLAFSVFFVSIALTSDMICYFFIPVQWLFFAASTYVWVQYVWHTEKGICLPTVVLWLLFAYMEAAVRLKDLRHMPFHLDLCRPFAAHCIGYPVVTLGFGFKSYVSYRIRQRKQRDVRKENSFYMNLLAQALPIEAVQATNNAQSQITAIEKPKSGESTTSNGVGHQHHNSNNGGIVVSNSNSNSSSTNSTSNTKNATKKSSDKNGEANSKPESPPYANGSAQHLESVDYSEKIKSLLHYFLRTVGEPEESESDAKEKVSNNNNNTSSNSKGTTKGKENSKGGGVVGGSSKGESGQQTNAHTGLGTQHSSGGGKRGGRANREPQAPPAQEPERVKDEYCIRLEADVRRLKSELSSSRQGEQELKSQINNLLSSEKTTRTELTNLQHHNVELQNKVQSLLFQRQTEKQSIAGLEKRLGDERRARCSAEAQLTAEKRAKQQESARAAAAIAAAAQHKGECTEACKSRRLMLENEIKQLRRELKLKEEKCINTDRELQSLLQYKESHNDAEMLMAALSALKDKTSHLENSLSAETRIKLDLFSALGEAKRQIEIKESLLRSQEREMDEIKAKMAQVLAVMPHEYVISPSVSLHQGSSLCGVSQVVHTSVSSLDPNASVYTPKQQQGQSGQPGVGHLATEA